VTVRTALTEVLHVQTAVKSRPSLDTTAVTPTAVTSRASDVLVRASFDTTAITPTAITSRATGKLRAERGQSWFGRALTRLGRHQESGE